MSKYLNLGMDLREVIAGGTWSAAQAIGREDLGHLSEGAVADVAILQEQNGTFGFVDAGGEKRIGNRKLQAELTLRAGRVVWDLNGLAAPVWRE
jgi:dihydroorotase